MIRTDLALEAKSIWESSKRSAGIPGVSAKEEALYGLRTTTVNVLDERGSDILCKPIGTYVTIDIEGVIKRKSGSFDKGANAVAAVLREMLGDFGGCVLVSGLGNRAVTPDRLGPAVADGVLATKHLVESSPQEFSFFRRVCVTAPGVLGETGIESGKCVRSAAADCGAGAIIAVDALCSASKDRLCSTVQITNTGIVPGSGVSGGRDEISRRTMGIPVLALGVPTVMSLRAASKEILGLDGGEPGDGGDMIVTPSDIDAKVADIAKLVAYGVNLALHKGLTVSDLDMLM